jgi:hypothetical protein
MGVWKFSVFRPERKNADREFIPHKGGDRKRYSSYLASQPKSAYPVRRKVRFAKVI